jgi:uncharacterized membrane protein
VALMNKEEYLKIIQKEIKKINTDEKEDILSEYESYFINGYKNNKNDEEIIKELGDPVKIAKEINAVNSLYKVENKKSVKSIFSAAFSIMELSILNLILIIFSFFVLLLFSPFILAYFIAVPIMIISPIILLVMGIINGFSTINTGDIIEVIKGVTLGIILVFIGYFITKYFWKLLVNYLNWNITIYKKGKMK